MSNASGAAQRTSIQPAIISPSLQLRPPHEPYRPTSENLVHIEFLHPGYADSENLLLILPAFDAKGIHHETARIACCILANCAWHGFLSLLPDGPRVPAGPDDVLTAPAYYFCVPDDPKYAVVPSFEHFRFPSQLPPSWHDNAQAPILSASPGVEICRLTCSSLPLETAHIIPAKDVDWWQENRMYKYARQPSASMDTHCLDNYLRLRKDVHTLWDAHRFAFVPKQGAWVTHVLEVGVTDELQALYHNLQLQPLQGVRREYLFARFAIAILDKPMFARQPGKGPRRLVWVETGAEEPGVKELSAQQCRAIFGPGARTKSSSRSPNKSPSKRTRTDGDEEDGCECDDSEDEPWFEAGVLVCDCAEEDEPERGRSRKRRRCDTVEQLHAEALRTHIPSLSHSVLSLRDDESPLPNQPTTGSKYQEPDGERQKAMSASIAPGHMVPES
ncbi:hypothetical protein B0T19DRAFT_445308 [Cercophora scortea]|uniref:HNH nuclease domain-containing protein n=1 Tax=Cercophora scortea TaxID=314031 RepID=A0AAE0I6Z0_9PEZI|nr:hypothetical protein B0T19DRAFT_445308 [Cercophora scortea]